MPGLGAGFGAKSSGTEGGFRANTWFMSECRDRRTAADFTSAPRPLLHQFMNASSPDFVTVDMRDLKAPLVACAAQRRVTVSVVVRGAVARELGVQAMGEDAPSSLANSPAEIVTWTKLSIRMRQAEAERLDAGARAAGLSRGAFLAGLVARVPVLQVGGRPQHIAALTASCAELSTISRNIHQLTNLLRAGEVQQALAYRDLLDSLADDVRKHLRLAAQVLANMRPGRDAEHSLPAGDPRKGR